MSEDELKPKSYGLVVDVLLRARFDKLFLITWISPVTWVSHSHLDFSQSFRLLSSLNYLDISQLPGGFSVYPDQGIFPNYLGSWSQDFSHLPGFLSFTWISLNYPDFSQLPGFLW